jgi:hypothetical protein
MMTDGMTSVSKGREDGEDDKVWEVWKIQVFRI